MLLCDNKTKVKILYNKSGTLFIERGSVISTGFLGHQYITIIQDKKTQRVIHAFHMPYTRLSKQGVLTFYLKPFYMNGGSSGLLSKMLVERQFFRNISQKLSAHVDMGVVTSSYHGISKD